MTGPGDSPKELARPRAGVTSGATGFSPRCSVNLLLRTERTGACRHFEAQSE